MKKAAREVGAFYFEIRKVVLDFIAVEISKAFEQEELPPFNPENYTGYKNRNEEPSGKMQQEIVSFLDSDPRGPGYDCLFRVARIVLMQLFPEYDVPETRLSGVMWRYRPENGETPEGCVEHVDFSLFGVLYQGAPGLYWKDTQNETVCRKVDAYKPGFILVTFGDTDNKYGLVKKYGFKKFHHGVDRITTQTRLAGAVFCDPANDVAEQMKAYHSST